MNVYGLRSVLPNCRIAIIGAGSGGIALLHHLASAGARNLDLTLFDGEQTIGSGEAYQSYRQHHQTVRPILNRHVERMSLGDKISPTFSRWLNSQGVSFAPDAFAPRELFGAYQSMLLATACERFAKLGCQLRMVIEPVKRLRVSDHVTICAGSALYQGFDVVVVTPGQKSRRLISQAVYSAAPSSRHVIIIGSGLSAAEVALQELNHDHDVTVSMVSPSGQLPAVRSVHYHPHITRHAASKSQVARQSCSSAPTLAKITQALDADLRDLDCSIRDLNMGSTLPGEALLRADMEAATRPLYWQSYFDGINIPLNRVYSHLSPDAQHQFRRVFGRPWAKRRISIPYQTADSLAKALDSKRLRLIRGSASNIVAQIQAKKLIDCSGHDLSLHDPDDDLRRSLRDDVGMQVNDLGHGLVDPETCLIRCEERQNTLTPSIYAMGGLTAGTFFFTSAIDVIAEQSALIAKHLIRTRPAHFEVSHENIG